MSKIVPENPEKGTALETPPGFMRLPKYEAPAPAREPKPMAQESSDATRLIRWMLGIGGVVIATGILGMCGAMWNFNAAIVRLESGQNELGKRFDNIEQRLSNGITDRYTGADAAKDRAGLMELLHTVSERNIEQDRELAEMMKFMAKVEERLKMGDKP